MEYILETNNLTKIYGQKEAAKDVNLHIKEGHIYGLILSTGALLVPWIFQIFVYPNWKDPVNMLNIAMPIILMFLLYWNLWWIIDTFIDQY